MKKEDFVYVAEANENFDDAVVSVLKAVEQKGWTIFQIYDLRERLKAKGFEQKRLKIIEICSAKHANNFLNKNKLISLCMPCKINVFEENGKVKIASMNPAMISQLFTEISHEETEDVEKDIKEIVDMSIKI